MEIVQQDKAGTPRKIDIPSQGTYEFSGVYVYGYFWKVLQCLFEKKNMDVVYFFQWKNQVIFAMFEAYVETCVSSANGKFPVWVRGLDSWDPLMKGIVT